jgi:uracil-DNA glycosylase
VYTFLMQVHALHNEIDQLQTLHGEPTLQAIYGAGCTTRPKIMMVFMNPTAKNVSAHMDWKGLRAPWLGTKSIWTLLYELGLLSETQVARTQSLKAHVWTEAECIELYEALSTRGVYLTNLAKCTQLDARPVKDEVFRQYLDLMKREIAYLKPKRIITFGNQVSSILLAKPISVSTYTGADKEEIVVEGQRYPVYPTYYPVGHGRMNQPRAIARINSVIG